MTAGRHLELEILLREGELAVDGRLPYASNASFCGTVAQGAVSTRCVYKPIRGERPLFDFPDGTLAFREVAAYLVSQATGWGVVPPTVLRDGPLGEGMVQAWIDVDERVDIGELLRARDERLRRVALFDAIVNNTDRKGGHLLVTGNGHVYGVDHGVTFSALPKLRTVLWGWRGQRFAPAEVEVLGLVRAALARELGSELRRLLHPREVRATTERVERLLAEGAFPHPDPGWPAIPWPPF